MAHWRDGGIGNMAGSDDREAEEFTLLERLTVIAGHSRTDAQFNVADVAQEAFNFIEPITAAERLSGHAELIKELRERTILGGGYADVSDDELERLIGAITAKTGGAA